ncbi:MAG: tRNA-dihydrouridine synthase [Deltaproteobacteria bacterium]|nr:tRNA-dihydrouridine synthase [Deltaproteobacteria bacterium]
MSQAIPKGKTWEFAAKIKSKVTIPVIAVGQINERDDPEKILKDGLADAVAIGRPLIADPDFVGKVLGDIRSPIYAALFVHVPAVWRGALEE